MTKVLPAPAIEAAAGTRLGAGLAALFLGVFLIWGAGLANSTALHEVAHDTRHGYGFPCH